MSALLTSLGSFFDTSLGWVGDIIDEVVATPALLIMVIAMPVIGFGYGLLSRLIRM